MFFMITYYPTTYVMTRDSAAEPRRPLCFCRGKLSAHTIRRSEKGWQLQQTAWMQHVLTEQVSGAYRASVGGCLMPGIPRGQSRN
jgi:hypothetical protein